MRPSRISAAAVVGHVAFVLLLAFCQAADADELLCWNVRADGRIVDSDAPGTTHVCAHYGDFHAIPPGAPGLPDEATVVEAAKRFGGTVGGQITTVTTGGNEGHAVCTASIVTDTDDDPGNAARQGVTHVPDVCRASSSATGKDKGQSDRLYHGPTSTGPRGQGGTHTRIDNSHNSRGDGIDPVNPATGDFLVYRADLTLPGKAIDFTLSRSYHSRLDYDGPMGHAWDHSYNQRLLPTQSSSCEGELLYMAGNSGTLLFREVSQDAQTIVYEPEEPVHLALRGHKVANHVTTWTLTESTGDIKTFENHGLLSQIETANHSGLVFLWEPQAGTQEWRLSRVRDSVGREIQFRYFDNGRLHEVVNTAGPGGSHLAEIDQLRATYEYTPDGDLDNAIDAQNRREFYGYSDPPHPGATEPDYIPEGYVREACALACQPSDQGSCHAGGGCNDADATFGLQCRNEVWGCRDACGILSDSLYGFGEWEHLGPNPEVHAGCMNTPDIGCVDRCNNYCYGDAADTRREETCSTAWDLSISHEDRDGDGFNDTICDSFAWPPNPASGIGCNNYCTAWAGTNSGNNYWHCYNDCKTFCNVGFIQSCEGSMRRSCQDTCDTGCELDCRRSGKTDWYSKCVQGDSTVPDSRGCDIDGNLAYCDSQDWGKICDQSCTEGCVQAARGPAGQAPRYGYATDLGHNLERIYNGDHVLYLENIYGKDLAKPSFDAVITQKMGDRVWQLDYRDLRGEEEGVVAPPTTGPAAQGIESLDDYVSYEVCPSVCASFPAFQGTTEYVPWDGRLLVVKGLPKVGGLGIQRATASLPPTLLRLDGAKAISATGSAFIAPGMEMVVSTGSGDVTLTASTTNPAEFSLKGRAEAIRALDAYRELTFVTEAGTGVMRAYPGQPLGLVQLAKGGCSTAFQATRDAIDQIGLTPAAACAEDLLVAPLASAADSDGYVDDYQRNGASAFAEMDLFAPTTLAPARHTVELRMTEVPGVYQQAVGPRDGASPTGLASSAVAVVGKSSLFTAPAIGGSLKPPVFVFHVPAAVRGVDKSSIVYDTPRDFAIVTDPSKCDLVIIGDPAPGIGDKGPGAKPIKATAVLDGYGSHWVHYYDEKGQSIRTRNLDTDTNRWTSYNYFGDVTGELEPAHNRGCYLYNASGSLVEADRYPVPGALGPSTPIRQRFSYTTSGPERLEKIFDPRDPTKVLTSFQWNPLGNLVSSRDALGQETTYAPTVWGTPTQARGPGVFDRYVPNDDTGMVEQVITDSGSTSELVSLYDFDPAGRPRLAQDPFGNMTSWDWRGPILDAVTFESGSRQAKQSFTYTGTGEVETVDDGSVLTALRYDGFGGTRNVTTTPKTGTDPAAITCRHNGPFGRVLETIGPEGERTKYVYDGEGRVTQVVAGWWPSSNEPWEAGCITTTSLAPTAPFSGPQTVQRLEYDANGWVIGVTDARGERTAVVNDGFGRPIMVTDASGNQKRAGYDNMNHPLWTSVYAAAGPPGTTTPTSIPYRQPSITDTGLLAAAQQSYDEKGRLKSDDVWHFDENHAWVGDGMAHTEYEYHESDRELVVRDDAGGVTKIKTDGAGRPVRRTLPTGDVETYAYGVRNGQPTVTHTWPAPTPSGTRSETTIMMPWGAPSSIVSSDSGREVTLASFGYDERFRPFTQTSASGETVTTTYDGFGRTKTVSTSKQPGLAEIVTLGYDRSSRVRRHTSEIPGGATAATAYQFDVLGRVTRVDRPAGVFEAIAYPYASPVPITSTDSRGMTKGYVYEDNGQLKTITVAASATESMNLWQERRFVHDGLGRIIQATDTGDSYTSASDDVVTNFRWDSLGSKRQEWNSLLGAGPGVSTAIDGLGRPTTQVVAGKTLARQFDPIGRLIDLRIDSTSTPAAHFTYQGLGGAKERTYGNGVKTVFDFDAFGRQVGQTDSKAGAPLAKWRWATPLDGVPRMAALSRQSAPDIASVFSTDAGGRIEAEDYGVKGASVTGFTLASDLGSTAANQAAASLIHTGFGRGPGGFGSGTAGSGWRAYQLDARNNWTARTAGTPAQALPNIVLNALDAITSMGSASVQYDGAGNLTDDGADLKLVYNRFAQPKTVYLGIVGVRSYRYDALGRRVSETDLTTGTTTVYGFDGASRTVRKQLPNGPYEVTVDGDGIDEHLVRVDNTASRYYYHQDRNHSVYLVTDNAGTPAEWYEYTAQGEMTILSPQAQLRAGSAIGNRFGYQGQPFDVTTGLVDMRARLYRPSWGRFIMADPIGLRGGANMFAFANGAPLSFWDPLGLDYGHLGPKSPGIPGFPTPSDWEDVDFGAILGNPPVDDYVSVEDYERVIQHDMDRIAQWQRQHWEDAVYEGLYARARYKDLVLQAGIQIILLPVGELIGPFIAAGVARGGSALVGLGRGALSEGLSLFSGRATDFFSRRLIGAAELDTFVGGGLPKLFANQLPELLPAELAQAARLGVTPIEAGAPGFEALVNSGTVKFAVLEDGSLVVAPKFVDGVEISHAVLSGGRPVLAAGEADIAAAGGSYFGTNIVPHSGHFLNGATVAQSAAVEAIARQAFARIGITF